MRVVPLAFRKAAAAAAASSPEVVGFGFGSLPGGSASEITVTFRNLADDADQDAEADDLVIALVSNIGTRDLDIPTNWTQLIAQTQHSGQAGFRAMACYRRLPSSQSSQAFTITGGASQSWNVGCVVVRGSNSTPINQVAGFAEGTSTTPTSPTLTTTTNLCRIIRMVAVRNTLGSEDTGYPGSHTGIYFRNGAGGSPSSNGAASAEQATAGAVGTAAWSSNNDRWLAATVAVQP